MGYKYEVAYCNIGDTYANYKIFKYRIFALLFYCYCSLTHDFISIRRRIKNE